MFFDDFSNATDITTEYTSATHYSYDPHGNVIETHQDVPLLKPVEQDIKSTQYEFELISGNVTKVNYQKGEIDAFTHEYHYDELNRLTEVYTTSDEVHKSRDAAYHYYDYGPLARTELGQYNVQGSDYTYTINGWLKGMNSNSLTRNTDIGRDGTTGFYSNNGNIHKGFAKDVVGFSLGYYDGDYSPIGGNSFEADYSNSSFGNGSANLYNGNIRHMVTAIEDYDIQGYAYTYDQLQRLTQIEVYRDPNLSSTNNWNSSAATTDYLTQISYDKNGNILTLDRNGYQGAQTAMDNMSYNYNNIAGELSNRLGYVDDGAQDFAGYEDIKQGQSSGNYKYNKLGELTEDASENMELEWRLGDHKLKHIRRTDQNSPNLEFVYNPLGVRVAKINKPRSGGNILPQSEWSLTYYTYDANGQLMATYETELYMPSKKTILSEQYIYGSSRVGLVKSNKIVFENGLVLNPAGVNETHELGNKRYELTNHLGNVLSTITDRKVVSGTYTELEELLPSISGPGLSISNNTITSTASTGWGNSGGSSIEKIEQGESIVWTHVTPSTTNRRMMVGLSYIDVNEHYNSIDFAWYAANSGINIYESGTQVVSGIASHSAGDVYEIKREAGNIIYFRNGNVERTVPDPQPTNSMYIDFSMYYSGTTIEDLVIKKKKEYALYDPVITMKADYYAFGMLMPDRNEGIGESRHLFNGMEADVEVSGDGNSYTTQFRQYDPRLGRWKSLDPLMSMFSHVSPYVGFANNPIVYTDPYGLAPSNGGYGDPPKDGDTRTANGRREIYMGGSWGYDASGGEELAGYGEDKSYISKLQNFPTQPSDRLGNSSIEIPEYISQEQYNENLWRKRIEEINSRPHATIESGKTDGQKLTEYNLKLYGPYTIPGWDIAMKMKDGEQIDASDWFIEGLGIIPAGKILSKGGKLFLKVGDKTTDITQKGLKNMVCFIAGTPISTEEGIKPIEDIEVDDLVWAFDEETGDIKLKTVYNKVVRETDHLEKLVIGSDTLHTTSNHPFWVSNTWKPAGELIAGDTLTLRNNEKLVLNYKEKIDTVATVYNFAVSEYSTYFVGDQEILVHNDNPCAQGGKLISKKAQDIYNSISTKIRGQNGYVDLSKFVDGKHKKSGYSLSKTVGNPHGDDAIWKLIDKKGNRVATLDSTGKILRK